MMKLWASLTLFLFAALASGQIHSPFNLVQALNGKFAERTATDTGLLQRLFLTEGSGRSLTDSSGNACNVMLPSLDAPSWRNGGLNFTAGVSAAVQLSSCLSNVHTIEVVEDNGVIVPPAPGVPLTDGYPTMFGFSAGNGVNIQASETYFGRSQTEGYGTHFLQIYQAGASGTTDFLSAIDNGVHVITLVIDPRYRTVTLYMDGVAQSPALAPPPLIAMAATGTTWEFGGSTGTKGCAAAKCGWGGGILGVGISKTIENADQVAQDSSAWHYVVKAKGVVAAGAFGPQDARQFLLGGDESVGSGHGLRDMGRSNFQSIAATGLNAAYPGEHWLGLANGADNANGYDISADCPVMTASLEQHARVKIFVWHTHANTATEGTGVYRTNNTNWPSLVGSDDTAISQDAAALDVAALKKCLSASPGWQGIIATAIGGPIANDADYDAVTRQPYNGSVRRLGSAAGDVFDPANEARFGPDGAGGLPSNSTSCNGGPLYNIANHDSIHPSLCGQIVLADELEAVVANIMNREHPRLVSKVTAYAMGLPDVAESIRTSASVKLLPCGGLLAGVRMITIRNTSPGSISVDPSREYLGGAADAIGGSSTYRLPAYQKRTFVVTWDGVAGDNCGFTAINE